MVQFAFAIGFVCISLGQTQIFLATAVDTLPQLAILSYILVMRLASKALKLSDGDVHQSGLLRKLQEDGFAADIDVPFDCTELSCWLRKSEADDMDSEGLVNAIKVGTDAKRHTNSSTMQCVSGRDTFVFVLSWLDFDMQASRRHCPRHSVRLT